jgi:hypothetical protein
VRGGEDGYAFGVRSSLNPAIQRIENLRRLYERWHIYAAVALLSLLPLETRPELPAGEVVLRYNYCQSCGSNGQLRGNLAPVT